MITCTYIHIRLKKSQLLGFVSEIENNQHQYCFKLFAIMCKKKVKISRIFFYILQNINFEQSNFSFKKIEIDKHLSLDSSFLFHWEKKFLQIIRGNESGAIEDQKLWRGKNLVHWQFLSVSERGRKESWRLCSPHLYIPPDVPSYLHSFLRPPHYLSLPFFPVLLFFFFFTHKI